MAIRVLLAEDSHDLRLLMQLAIEQDRRLELIGEARTGREAVALAEKERPDVVVLDLDLPEMDGFSALLRIRQGSPTSKVLVWSSVPVSTDLLIELGADAHCVKGESIFSVTSRIPELCGN